MKTMRLATWVLAAVPPVLLALCWGALPDRVPVHWGLDGAVTYGARWELVVPALLPLLTFIISMLLSFSTGTSMGTMAIMAVIALPMAANMGTSIPLVAGAMFGGSIFGDHASPISDTTIMSCATTGCNIIDHVKTQMPYVCCFAGISMVLYVILGFFM